MRSTDQTFFKLKRLHAVFAASAVALVVVTVWMLVADHRRPWRAYQQTYRERIEPWTTAARLRDAEAVRQGKGVSELRRQWAAQQPSLAKRLLGLPLVDCFGRPERVEQIWLPELRIDYNFRQVARFDRCTTCHQAIDQSLPGAPTRPAYHRQQSLTLRLATPATAPTAGQGSTALEKTYGFALAERGVLADVAPTVGLVLPRSPAAAAEFEVGDVLVRVGGQSVADRAAAVRLLTENVAWGKPLAIEVRRGLQHPFASHPRLDLFVGSTSPHPVAEFGCTICHEGQGSATGFTFASHSPNRPEQRADWRRRYGWFHNENWDLPMLPSRLAESRCVKCHHQVSGLEASRKYPTPPAPKLLAGYHLVRQLGCFGCHEINGYDDTGRSVGPDLRLEPAGKMRKVGPALGDVGSRLGLQLLAAQVENPASVRPTGRMPKLFGLHEHLEAEAPEETRRREALEIRAVSEYLLAATRAVQLLPAPSGVSVTPSAERGRRLFEMQGCLGCHQHEAFPEGQSIVGPNLTGLGSKYTTPQAKAWLASWIRNPPHHAPRTAMPVVTFATEEAGATDPAADLAAWLVSSTRTIALPELPQPELAPAELRALGERTIRRRGCFGCHDIPGFEKAQPIGPALADWGRKQISLLAFEQINALVEKTDTKPPADETQAYFREALLSHRREGFAWQKLRAPRSFDYQKKKPFEHQLLMGRFTLTDVEREAIVTFVMGLVAQPPANRYVYQPGVRQRAIVEGRKVIDQYGCAECHTLEMERWTLQYDPAKFPAPAAMAEFAFLGPKLPAAMLAASKAVDRRGLARVEVAGMPRVDAKGQLQEDEDDDGNPLYGFTLWEPAAVAGQVWTVGGPDLLVNKSQLAARRAPWGGAYARLLYPAVLAQAQAAGSSASQQEAWGWVPPVLAGIGRAVAPQWTYDYLLHTRPIRPAAVLRMPQFNLSPEEARKLADYFAAASNAEFPYAATGGSLPASAAEEQARLARFDRAMKFLVDRKTYCAKCHLVGQFGPGGESRTVLAPDLEQVARRIRPEYLRRWLAAPKSALPYTAMPQNFPPSGNPLGQDIYPGTSLEQLDAVVELLLNYDWYAARRARGKW
jgi:cbb3-type cytochrome oxidase cytochrome c subunit